MAGWLYLPPQQEQVQVPSAQLPPQSSQQHEAVSSIIIGVSPPSGRVDNCPLSRAERDKNRCACGPPGAAATRFQRENWAPFPQAAVGKNSSSRAQRSLSCGQTKRARAPKPRRQAARARYDSRAARLAARLAPRPAPRLAGSTASRKESRTARRLERPAPTTSGATTTPATAVTPRSATIVSRKNTWREYTLAGRRKLLKKRKAALSKRSSERGVRSEEFVVAPQGA